MNLLVTGGAGFIGSNFVRRYLSQIPSEISKIRVLDSLTYAGNLENLGKIQNSKNFEFQFGNICDTNDTLESLESIDAVINFAAESHVDRSIESASKFVSTNIGGVQVILDSIRKLKRRIRFIQVSTDEVYGSIKSGSWTEDFPMQPNSPYSASKASGELIARSYYKTHNLDIVVTRCSNNYGPYHYPEKLIPFFITNLIEGKKVPIYGNGLNVRDWLHVNDHCDAIYKVLLNGKSGEVYNVGGGLELANIEITKIILEKMGHGESSIEFIEDRKGHDFRYSVDWSKIQRQLGYEPKIDFMVGIEDTINWYRANESWWKPLKN